MQKLGPCIRVQQYLIVSSCIYLDLLKSTTCRIVFNYEKCKNRKILVTYTPPINAIYICGFSVNGFV